MIIGVPKEIKDNEYRVSMVPSGARALVEAGSRVLVERGAGLGSGITDEDFIAAGAEITGTAAEVYASAEIIIKVKEPQPVEFSYLRDGLTIFTFFHLAADPALFEALTSSGVTAVAYETMEEPDGRLPVLQPMSEVAGRLSVQFGAEFLSKAHGGRGVLLGGVPGVERGRVLIIGAGTVGINATKTAVGLGAEVTVLDTNTEKFRHIDEIFGGAVDTLMSNTDNIEKCSADCDILIGAVHRAGGRTPRLVTREMVTRMREGSVIVDVSIDQGGSVETIRPTTHSDPVYTVDGVLHYGVTNMPGAVPRTSTYALTNATLPYLLRIAAVGLKDAALNEPAILSGINTLAGKVTNRAVADAFSADYTSPSEIF
ncbi:MAG: alanine dehydrogenase [Thermodesulfobacteriota bacterium]